MSHLSERSEQSDSYESDEEPSYISEEDVSTLVPLATETTEQQRWKSMHGQLHRCILDHLDNIGHVASTEKNGVLFWAPCIASRHSYVRRADLGLGWYAKAAFLQHPKRGKWDALDPNEKAAVLSSLVPKLPRHQVNWNWIEFSNGTLHTKTLQFVSSYTGKDLCILYVLDSLNERVLAQLREGKACEVPSAKDLISQEMWKSIGNLLRYQTPMELPDTMVSHRITEHIPAPLHQFITFTEESELEQEFMIAPYIARGDRCAFLLRALHCAD